MKLEPLLIVSGLLLVALAALQASKTLGARRAISGTHNNFKDQLKAAETGFDYEDFSGGRWDPTEWG